MSVALIQHSKNDVDRDDCGEEQEGLALARFLCRLRLASPLGLDSARKMRGSFNVLGSPPGPHRWRRRLAS